MMLIRKCRITSRCTEAVLTRRPSHALLFHVFHTSHLFARGELVPLRDPVCGGIRVVILIRMVCIVRRVHRRAAEEIAVVAVIDIAGREGVACEVVDAGGDAGLELGTCAAIPCLQGRAGEVAPDYCCDDYNYDMSVIE